MYGLLEEQISLEIVEWNYKNREENKDLTWQEIVEKYWAELLDD